MSMSPTTMETAAPGFVLWCPTFGPTNERGDPLGLAFQCDDPTDPLKEAEVFAEAQGLWGYLRRVDAGGGGVAVCRVPEHEEDVAVGKPRYFSGVSLKVEAGKPAKVETVAPAKQADINETVTWDAARKVLERKAVLLDDSEVEKVGAHKL